MPVTAPTLHPARRHGRVLRVGRAARRPGAARQAGDRRRRRAGAASSRPRATRCASSACTRRCRCARRCAAAPTRSACTRASRTTPVSRSRIFAVFHEFTPLVQGLSLDEAFLDVTGSIAAFGQRRAASRGEIKRRIRERTELTASVGVAPNKLVAKIASDLRKPDGLVVVAPREVRPLLDPLPIRRLFGLGAKTAPKVEALGIHTLGDLRRANPAAAAADLRPLHRARAAARRRHRRSPGRSRTSTRSRSAPRRHSRPTSPTTRSCTPRSSDWRTRPARACARASWRRAA